MNNIQLFDLTETVEQLNEASLTNLHQQYKSNQIKAAIQTVLGLIDERFRLTPTEQPPGDREENDLLDMIYLAIACYCEFNERDFKTSLQIARFCLAKYTDITVEWLTQWHWVQIACLERLALLDECLSCVESLLARNDLDSRLRSTLQKKLVYLRDFLDVKRPKLLALSEDERHLLAKRLSDLLSRQDKEEYFNQQGVFAYLISWEWLNRWKLFTGMYLEMKEDPEEIRKELLPLAQRSLLWGKLLPLLDVDETVQQLQITPILNDQLLQFKDALLLDPLKPKDYCNYQVNPNAKEGQEYMYMSWYIWKELHEHFGGLEVKRMILSIDDRDLKFAVEAHPKLIRFILTSDVTRTHVLQINRNETVKDLVSKISRILGLKSKISVWKPLNETTLQTFLKDMEAGLAGIHMNEKLSLDESDIGAEDVLVIEVDGPRIRQLKPQKLMPQVERCAHCENTNRRLLYCQCYLVKYCDAECQAKDRKRHQEACNGITSKSKRLQDQAKRFKVRPPSKITDRSSRGLCGLQNLGNTCFMNSSLQCLSNVYELTEFLISNQFLVDINDKNALGTGGKLIASYAELLKDLWEGSERYVSPWHLKGVISKVASQFSGYNQQDSQELLNYLIDGIHEDLNRVKHKPYIPSIDYRNQTDEDLAALYWRNHLARNNSIVTDLFTGQYKTKVKCPQCENVSITFDPFLAVSLPITQVEQVSLVLYLIYRNSARMPLKISLLAASDRTAAWILQEITQRTALTCLRLYVFKNSTIKQLSESLSIAELNELQTNIFAFEVSEQPIDKPLCTVTFHIITRNGTQVSFARIIDLQLTENIRVEVYRYLRPFLLSHLSLRTEMAQLVSQILQYMIIAMIVGTHHCTQEIDKWDQSGRVPYRLTNSDGTEFTQVEQRVDLKVVLADYIKGDALRMNKYTDAPFNIVAKSGGLSVRSCIEQFGRKEVLGVGDEWYCSKCKQHQRAAKKMQIYKAPNILILHLKRFKTTRVYSSGSYFFHGGSQKITSFIDYPITSFDINDLVLCRKKDTTIDYTYDLFAVSNHYGGLGGGHYTAYAKNPILNEWYSSNPYSQRFDFNDSSVRRINPEQAVSENAYVLFYRRRGSPQCRLGLDD